MKKLFNPAILLMNKLKYIHKFSLIFMLSFIPMIALNSIGITHINKSLRSAEKQQIGLKYNIELRKMIQLLQQHRGLTALYLGGQPELKKDILDNEKEIWETINSMEEFENKCGDVLRTSSSLTTIRNNWTQIQQNIFSMRLKDSYEKQTDLITDMIELNRHVAETSTLILETQMERYYLIDTIVNKFVWASEYLGQARAIGAGVAAKKSINPEERVLLLERSRSIMNAFITSKDEMGYVYKADDKLQMELEPITNKVFNSTENLVITLQQEIIDKDNIKIDAMKFYTQSTEVLDGVFDLLTIESNYLDKLYTDDINKLTNVRTILVVLSVLLSSTILYLFFGFYISMKESVTAIEKATAKIADGEIMERVKLQADDETKAIEKSLNRMLDSLIANFKSTESILNENYSKVQKANEDLDRIAHYDALTGLPNRVLFKKKLSSALEEAKRNGTKAAVLFLDLDRFKLINDTLGHHMGDQLLRDVGHELSKVVGLEDAVSRLGGDEFTILLPGIKDNSNAIEVASNVLEVIRSPWILCETEYYITTSIGIAMYPDNGDNEALLIKNADMAMYRAKEQGKNNYQFYSASMDLISTERLLIENNLIRALEENEFYLDYQPKVDILSGRISGVEALIRWNNPKLGIVSPAKFIPVAEETGLILPIGEWVLRTACRQNKLWQDSGFPPIKVSVNLSARQFHQYNLLKVVTNILEETGLEPKYLELEITEGTTISDIGFTISMLEKLKNMGITISVDDFGKGFSSLNYLKNFKIDTLKIDSAFVQDINDNYKDSAIVSTIVVLAKNMKLNVIAEGVENYEQLEYLKSQGCNEIQGYLFSKPVTPEEIVDMLQKGKSLQEI